MASRRAQVVVAAVVGVLLLILWRLLAPPAIGTPAVLGGHPRHDQGFYFDLAEQVRAGAAQDPRLGLTVAAVYGAKDQPLPTFGVLAGGIKFGYGEEIIGGVVSGLAIGGVTLGPRTPAPAGKHGGTFECGTATLGQDEGTYCVWWTASVVGVAVVADPDPEQAQKLALAARTATQR